MEKLKYSSTERYVEGVIVEVKSGAYTIDLKGRLGQLKIPARMLITDWEVEIGQEVGFLLSYPEVLGPEINQKYKDNLEHKPRIETEE
ncbi:MAG: CBO2463/CBO2479 domain-containing protein [Filifactoraceae bacterium]